MGIALLLIALLLPWAASAPARRVLDRCAPVAALWTLAVSALLLAAGTVAALGTLALTGLLRLPALAALGEPVHPLHTPSARLVLPLAARCHPALRPVRAAIRLAAERAADEAAATAVGDRRLTARAIARAALATHTADTARPAMTPAATSGPVPRRVAALLSPAARPPRGASWIAALLTACALLSCTTAATGAIGVHQDIEVAQGDAA
ncbi:hypothetical protein AB0E88_29510, partial [Streptomyces sp. NPDC028635]